MSKKKKQDPQGKDHHAEPAAPEGKLSRKLDESELARLHGELVKLQIGAMTSLFAENQANYLGDRSSLSSFELLLLRSVGDPTAAFADS